MQIEKRKKYFTRRMNPQMKVIELMTSSKILVTLMFSGRKKFVDAKNWNIKKLLGSNFFTYIDVPFTV